MDISKIDIDFIGKEVSDEDFIKFLKACHDEIQSNGTHKEQLFNKNSDGLSEDVKETIWALFEHHSYCGNIRQNGADVQINVESGAGYDRILTLLIASGIPKGKFDCLSFENVAYHIYCIEEYVDEHLLVEFICGTE